jgi:transforming growth factor-beta-induced protein
LISNASFIIVEIAQLSDIVQTAVEDGRFQTLVTLLSIAGLDETLKGPGPFTLLAPTDAAFNKLSPSIIADLFNPDKKLQLIKTLTYHVVSGKSLTAADIIALNPPFKLEMLDNIVTSITAYKDQLKVNDATIIEVDIFGSNGIIHVLDTVLLPPDIVQVIYGDDRLRNLGLLQSVTGFTGILNGSGSFTVFAPTDAAFAKLPPDTIPSTFDPGNKPKLIEILAYHIVDGRTLTAADIIAMNPPFKLEMLNEIATSITKDGNQIKVNNATVIQANVFGINGVIHVIDTVLLSPDILQTVIDSGRFEVLSNLLSVAGLAEILKGPGPLTLFAPTDAAFAALPPGTISNLLKPENKLKLIKLLTYYVVEGQALTAANITAMNPPFKLGMLNGITTSITKDGDQIKVNNGTVIQADVIARNGVVHFLDTALLPPDIVQIAIDDGRFRTLVEALSATGLSEVLQNPGPFTLFAPTDAAFAKLPPSTIADLLKPENRAKLIKILTYHVVGGRTLTTSDIIAMNPPFKLEMLNGVATNIDRDGDQIKINNATVMMGDAFGSNGLIHAIDTVLLL